MAALPTMTEPVKRERFVLLDGLRGIAALFIVQRHIEPLLGKALPSSYLGVDLFFALSGFVLAHAYGAVLKDGRMSPLQFMTARFLRLYPLYGIALVLVVAYYIHMYFAGRAVMAEEYVIPGELAAAVVTGLFFLPTPFTISFNAALFLVHPAWSLFNELVANVVYAAKGVHASVRRVGIVIAISAVLLVVAAIDFDRLHAGFRWNEMYAGFARVFFSFSVGMLIYRFRPKMPKARPVLALLCLLAVAAVLASPTPRDLRAPFDLLVVLLVWPSLLYVASGIVPDARTGAVASFLGTASYGVYVLHTPLADWAIVLWPNVLSPDNGAIAGIALIAAITFISWLLTVGFDEPLQKRFKRWLRRPRTAVAAN
ncbi:acyltransferase family protein [Rhizobium populisoli]|uniref:acyltransferase family protein n=1 Tax=Rhizobium populisoli TaxID=2859785 RepID=UPI001FE851F5|nr:acyltransferase [Rhizobium populisoli]